MCIRDRLIPEDRGSSDQVVCLLERVHEDTEEHYENKTKKYYSFNMLFI